MKYHEIGLKSKVTASSWIVFWFGEYLEAFEIYGQSSWLHNGEVKCFLWGTNRIYICNVEESRPPLWSGGQSSWLHNGDVLCFLWGTNRIYICNVEESRPPLWSSGQSSWLQIRRSGFDSRHYQKKSSGSGTGSTQPCEYNWGAT
jgi:hypothetical protein